MLSTSHLTNILILIKQILKYGFKFNKLEYFYINVKIPRKDQIYKIETFTKEE